MQKVPQIVRERLKAATAVANHPDADLLTAFTERKLPALERSVVLEHLARCGECREIVALALPEGAAAVPGSMPARSGWLTWPAFRWGFAAAGIIAVSVLGIVQYQRSLRRESIVAKEFHKQQWKAALQGKPQPPAEVPEPSPGPNAKRRKQVSAAPLAKDASSNHAASSTEPKTAAGVPSLVRAPENRNVVGGAIGAPVFGPKGPIQWQQQQDLSRAPSVSTAKPSAEKQQNAPASQSLAAPPAAARAVTVEVQSQALQLEAKSQEQGQSLPAPRTSEGLFDNQAVGPVGKAKPAENANPLAMHGASGGAVPLNGRNLTPMTSLAAIPRWAINSVGVLQRSFDQGKNWSDVDVNANLLPSTAGMAKLALASSMRAPQNESDKKASPAPLPVPVFRAVSANGPDIWAGGSNGTLYHSLDAGDHWIKVVPTAAGLSLSDDIVAVEFTDALRGRVTSSSGDVWTTADGGQTWQKHKQ